MVHIKKKKKKKNLKKKNLQRKHNSGIKNNEALGIRTPNSYNLHSD